MRGKSIVDSITVMDLFFALGRLANELEENPDKQEEYDESLQAFKDYLPQN